MPLPLPLLLPLLPWGHRGVLLLLLVRPHPPQLPPEEGVLAQLPLWLPPLLLLLLPLPLPPLLLL